MAATIRDVAKKAGVSVGTVSRYLNGYTLKERNRRLIEDAIKALDFKENIIAKGLKNNRTMTIGVVIGSLTDLFATSIVSALEKAVEIENYSIILCDYEGQRDKFQQKLNFLMDRSVDGLVVFPGNGMGEILKEAMGHKIPIVLCNEDITGLEADKVLVDNANASFRAVERLIHLNHRKIAVISGPESSYTGKERLKGYLDALKTYGIPIEDRYVRFGGFASSGGYTTAKELLTLSDPPTALYVTNYYMTLGAVMAINELGIDVPGKLSVIGFDSFELLDAVRPRLTVVEQPVTEIGENVAAILLKRMRGDYKDFPSSLQLNTRILVKESTAPFVEL